jgi:hypothetical protein
VSCSTNVAGLPDEPITDFTLINSRIFGQTPVGLSLVVGFSYKRGFWAIWASVKGL